MHHVLPMMIGLAAVTGLPAAAPAQMPSAPVAYSPREIHDYASALYQILAVRRMSADRKKGADSATRAKLDQQTRASIARILDHFGFTEQRFNQISATINHQQALRREVRQLVMSQGLGYE